MADIVWSDVVDVAAELATGVSAGFQTKILGYVNRRVSQESFPDDETYVLARCYLAAHYGKLQKESSSGAASTAGAITSMSEGGVSIGFGGAGGASSARDPSLSLTKYGQTFQGLVRQSAGSVGFVS